MNDGVLGLHHITAIAGSAQKNFDFYTKVLGQRLVKKTVNFDDPETYHLYYGDREGTPGTVLTFFPWEGITPGTNGYGMSTEVSYAVTEESLEFWYERFKSLNIQVSEISNRFGEKYISINDPDNLHLNLIAVKEPEIKSPFETAEINFQNTLKGFHSTTLRLKSIDATAKLLTEILGYTLFFQENNRYRFRLDHSPQSAQIDLLEDSLAPHGHLGAGSIHHVAFRVANEEVLMSYREKVAGKGFQITPKINRDYFFSLYFREPGGVLFELATDNPGFTADESIDNLGTALQLPEQYEKDRAEIEKKLPKIL